MSIIIYGPPGCGKTFGAKTIQQHFGLAHILDDYVPGAPLPPDTLALTNVEGTTDALNYFEVAQQIVLKQVAQSLTLPDTTLLRVIACQLEAIGRHLGVASHKLPYIPSALAPSPDDLTRLFGTTPQGPRGLLGDEIPGQRDASSAGGVA